MRHCSFWSSVLIGFCLLALFRLLPLTHDLEGWSIDQRFAWRGKLATDPDILLVGIDERTLTDVNVPHFAWGPVLAAFVDRAQAAGAKGVMLDLLLPVGNDQVIFDRVRDTWQRYGYQLPPDSVTKKLGFDQELRSALLHARKQEMPVVLMRASEHGPERFLHSIAPHLVGFANLWTDDRRVVTGLELTSRDTMSGIWQPSAAFALARGMRPQHWSIGSAGAVLAEGMPLPRLSRQTMARLNFAGGRGTFPCIPLQDILLATASGDLVAQLSGKTLLLGFTTIDDLKLTPCGYMPGVECHATALMNLWHDRFLLATPPLVSFIALFTLLLCLAWAFSRGGMRWGLPLGLGSALLWALTAVHLFSRGQLLAMAWPFLTLFTFGLLETARLYLLVERDRARIQGLFGRYLDVKVIDQLLEQPDHHSLHGVRRTLCILLLDIRSFTSYSEHADPFAVVRILNRVLSQAVQEIQCRGGTIDKFLGDGLLAFFNAPIERASFADDAIASALAIHRMNHDPASIAGLDLPSDFSLSIGIAIHVGSAIVGNIGSERRMEYTAIGDPVNTVSRLESLNKELGTNIIVSEDFCNSVTQQLPWVDLGTRTLRGKQRPIRLFTVDQSMGSQPQGNEECEGASK